MSVKLNKALQERDAAADAYEAFVKPIIAEKRELTDEEKAQRKELRSAFKRLDRRVREIEKDEQRAEALASARARVASAVTVKSEPRTYGPGSPNSYFADFVRASSNQWKDHEGACERLARHSREVAEEMRAGSAEGQRARSAIRDAHRTENGMTARDAVREMESRAGMDTTAASGGSFVTPQYFVADYAPYRQFGRAFADAANKQPLPDYGMTIYLPALSQPAGVAAQVGQNQGITEQDPNAAYLSANLTTNAGQVTISQQLLDRAGPNFQFDKMVFDQLQRAYNLTLDAFVLTQALASAGTVSCTNAALYGAGGQFACIGKAKAATVDAAGVVLPATHAFFQPINWEWASVQTDANGRTLVVPDYAGVFNAIAAGSNGAGVAEGDTGFKLSGLSVFEDGNIPTAGGNNQIVVAHMPEVWFWEGDLVPRVIPQTYAQNLSVLLQVYAYVAAIVRYPKAVQSVTGTGVPANPTF
jgi:HK97 family phage major capsid protein